MAEIFLLVNGRRYGGWKAVRVTRSIESASGSFQLDVSDRWGGQDEPWPIAEEDPCRVSIDSDVVIDGYVEHRSIALSATERSLSFAGRDRAAALVDSSVILTKWSFRNTGLLAIAQKVAEPHDVRVTLQPGLVLPRPPKKFVVNPGETAFEVIQRAAQAAGALAVSDGAGGVVITRSGVGRAASLVQSDNVLAASVDYDATQRYSRYVVMTQIPGTNETSGAATRVRAQATDPAVRRSSRTQLLLPEHGITTDYARQRGDWEARIRAANSDAVTVVVLGWRQPSGSLWPVNALVAVCIPAIGVDGDMLISEVEYSIDDGGEVTQLRLVRPDAFTPEPIEAKVKQSGGLWKELAGGAR